LAKDEDKRTIWLIGKSKERKGTYVVSLPANWAEAAGGEGTEVILRDHLGSLLITPPIARSEPKKTELAVKEQESSLLRHLLISAYLNNFRIVTLLFEKPRQDVEGMLIDLRTKLSGFSFEYTTKSTCEVTMSTLIQPVPEILQKMLGQTQMINEINQNTFSNLKSAEALSKRVDDIEINIDQNSFLLKRLLYIAAEQQDMIERLGIGEISKIVHWATLNSSLERVGDLQHDIHEELKRLGESKVPLSTTTYDFITYHKKAQEMVDDAYFGDLKKITAILDTKTHAKADPKYRGDYIPKAKAESIQSHVMKFPVLMCLDVRIWGLTGLATNIAEARLNMIGPQPTEQRPEDFVRNKR